MQDQEKSADYEHQEAAAVVDYTASMIASSPRKGKSKKKKKKRVVVVVRDDGINASASTSLVVALKKILVMFRKRWTFILMRCKAQMQHLAHTTKIMTRLLIALTAMG
jgi:N-acyl-L-homoserine lactone synthetase